MLEYIILVAYITYLKKLALNKSTITTINQTNKSILDSGEEHWCTYDNGVVLINK